MDNKIIKKELPPVTLYFLDNEGYPTNEYLIWIQEFNPFEYDIAKFINVLIENWINSKYKYKKKYRGYRTLELHTSGYSGSEEIISSLEKNLYFFPLYWKMTIRGGHYYFSIPQVG